MKYQGVRFFPIFQHSQKHSYKILTIQQGEACYLTILSNPCTLYKKYYAGRSSVPWPTSPSKIPIVLGGEWTVYKGSKTLHDMVSCFVFTTEPLGCVKTKHLGVFLVRV